MNIAVKVKDMLTDKWVTAHKQFSKLTDRDTILFNLYNRMKGSGEFIVTLTDEERTFTYTSVKLETMFA